MRLIVITPVRNEEAYLGETVRSVVSQSHRPFQWVIVDDGSSDGTSEIAKRCAEEFPFVTYVHNRNRGFRQPGTGVVEAFYKGLEHVDSDEFELLAKLDGDLRFSSNTFKEIVRTFTERPTVGIVGGKRFDQVAPGTFQAVDIAKGWVGGPCKFYRRTCFNQIGGLVKRPGWDGIDIVRAKMAGWETGEIGGVEFYHLRPTGQAVGEGLARAGRKYGRVSYHMGGYFWYFLLRAMTRSYLSRNPKLLFYMIKGFFESNTRRGGRETRDFRRVLKRCQRENCAFWAQELFSRLTGRRSKAGLFDNAAHLSRDGQNP